jgi:hypothetical protein
MICLLASALVQSELQVSAKPGRAGIEISVRALAPSLPEGAVLTFCASRRFLRLNRDTLAIDWDKETCDLSVLQVRQRVCGYSFRLPAPCRIEVTASFHREDQVDPKVLERPVSFGESRSVTAGSVEDWAAAVTADTQKILRDLAEAERIVTVEVAERTTAAVERLLSKVEAAREKTCLVASADELLSILKEMHATLGYPESRVTYKRPARARGMGSSAVPGNKVGPRPIPYGESEPGETPEQKTESPGPGGGPDGPALERQTETNRRICRTHQANLQRARRVVARESEIMLLTRAVALAEDERAAPLSTWQKLSNAEGGLVDLCPGFEWDFLRAGIERLSREPAELNPEAAAWRERISELMRPHSKEN